MEHCLTSLRMLDNVLQYVFPQHHFGLPCAPFCNLPCQIVSFQPSFALTLFLLLLCLLCSLFSHRYILLTTAPAISFTSYLCYLAFILRSWSLSQSLYLSLSLLVCSLLHYYYCSVFPGVCGDDLIIYFLKGLKWGSGET